ncbi:hypothetical protein AWY79_17930 [Pseudodesulfovibrio indicus]|uniref:BioF2-like acetyltransferase domain-containing protein n=1 Tax=Pseudodesulfovibrio indicus TaxID=1716143 RepID=A0ABN4M4C5_9BACT|nr:hypothetical protein AWY79_17930 [Pseudodesulfovibrio indicus]
MLELKLYPPRSPVAQREAWIRAAVTTGQGDPFCCAPEWQMSYHEAFNPGRRLLIEASGGNVLAFAEHAPSPDEIFLTPIEAHWCFGCPLLGHDAVPLFEELLPEIERRYAPRFPRIVISGVRPDGPLPARLIRAFADRFDFYLLASSEQCGASLEGGLDGFLSRRSANHRKKLRKQRKRTQEQGVTFERHAPVAESEAAEVYARMLDVESRSWKGIGRCGMAETPALEFYDAMMRRLALLNGSRIIFARRDGRDIGFIFGGLAGAVYRGQQFSYDDEWKEFSIGNLMQVEQVGWLCEEGAARYDMGPLSGPKMGYKSHWTENRVRIETWALIRR